MSSESKPTCAVHGMLGPRAMCGSIIVGLKYCGHAGDCEHKVAPVAPLTRCAAARDGDCTHAQCPQLRDNEPHASGRHCPLDTQDDGE